MKELMSENIPLSKRIKTVALKSYLEKLCSKSFSEFA